VDVAKPGASGQVPLREATPVAGIADQGAGSAGPRADPADPRLQAAAATLADEALINALDESTALRILIAEVRQFVAADLLGAAPNSRPATPAPAALPTLGTPITPVAAAGWLLATFLAAVPADEVDPGAWIDGVSGLEQAFRAAYENAAAIVTAWRGVTPDIIASVHEAQTLFVTEIAASRDDGLVRAEWLLVAPRLDGFRRRRRAVRRRLEDPDHRWPESEESDSQTDDGRDDPTMGRS
jgi:hypothetical protein